MAIIGNAFEDYVKNQVNVRQSALAEGLDPSNPKKIQSIQAFNSSAPWMRLISAVDITNDKPKENGTPVPGKTVYDVIEETQIFSGFDWKNSNLSKNFVLLGGAASLNSDGSLKSLPSGIVGTKGALEGAYGYGYTQADLANGADLTSGRGYVPPPGVTSVDFEYKNDGALAMATINIKAFSDVQFNIIDILYQRPGFTVLLEFGHSVYLNNSGELEQADFTTSPSQYIFKSKGTATYNELATKIVTEKKSRSGNYEAFFGRITKFNWKYNEDGSYDITVKLTGIGDVLSSLKINGPKLKVGNDIGKSALNDTRCDKPTEKQKEDAEEEAKEGSGGAVVISEAGKSQLNFELFNFFSSDSYPFSDNSSIHSVTINDVPVGKSKYTKTFNKSLFKIDVNDWGGTEYSPLCSIKFGMLLTIIQKICNIKDKQGQHQINFGMVEDIVTGKTDDTYMVTYPGNFSSNPTKCLIKYDPLSVPNAGNVPNLISYPVLNEKLTKDTSNMDVPEPACAMRLSDVYVDIGFISSVLKDLGGSDKESKDQVEVSILDFLNSLLSGINSSLGGINNFRVLFDETNNRIEINSESPILSKKDTSNDYATINTFGLSSNLGSFVKELDLNSELTDAYATQISIGAQTNANTSSSGGGGPFSAYNLGLKDRLMVEKKSSMDEEEQDEEEIIDPLEEMWDEEVAKAFYQVYGDREFGDKYIPTLEGVVSNLSTFVIEQYSLTRKVPSPSFLPFNLSLTMHGLAGMKIFQSFRMDGKGLPPNYNPAIIKLIIKSLSHNVSLDGWKTKVETMSVPTTPKTKLEITGKFKAVTDGPSFDEGSGGSGNLPAPPPSKPPADEKTRIILRRLCDSGAETLGVMTVLDENGKELYVLPTVELPWKGNQNSVSCIPPNDTYRVKSHTSGKHGQCFWIVGNGQGGYKFNRLYGNGYVRSAVLIHRSPIAPGWLQGCIGPGLKFNLKQKQKGNPKGTGDRYLNPSKAQSQQAVEKLVGTLYAEGSFLMQIKNLNDVGEGQLPKDFNDPEVQKYLNASPARKKLIS